MGTYIYPVVLKEKGTDDYGNMVWKTDDPDLEIDYDDWPNKSHRLIVGDDWKIPCDFESDSAASCTGQSYYRPVDIDAAIKRVIELRDDTHPFIPVLELMKTNKNVYFELS